MTTDTSEKGLERLIVEALAGFAPEPAGTHAGVAEAREPWGGAGYVEGDSRDYDRDHALELAKLRAFVQATQPQAAQALGLSDRSDGSDKSDKSDNTPRLTQFLHRLQGEIARRGVIDVLRHGVNHGAVPTSSTARQPRAM